MKHRLNYRRFSYTPGMLLVDPHGDLIEHECYQYEHDTVAEFARILESPVMEAYEDEEPDLTLTRKQVMDLKLALDRV